VSHSKRKVPRINPRFTRYLLEVRGSKIHGYGVFALEEIPRGRRVIEYTGRRISLAQANRIRPPKEAYLAMVDREWVADPSVGGSGAEFINHSCRANLEWRRVRGHLYFYSRRRIRAEEELTGNYRYPTRIKRIPCHCGERNCRRTLRYLLSY
jgi:SET domain-containing protein